MDFFRIKTLKFFKIAKCGKLFLECVSNGNISLKLSFLFIYEVFWAKNKKKSTMEKLENVMKKQSILKKKDVFILLKGIFNKVGGCKISRW